MLQRGIPLLRAKDSGDGGGANVTLLGVLWRRWVCFGVQGPAAVDTPHCTGVLSRKRVKLLWNSQEIVLLSHILCKTCIKVIHTIFGRCTVMVIVGSCSKNIRRASSVSCVSKPLI